MPDSGTGVHSRVHNWVTDKNANIEVTASRMDADSDDISTALTNRICKDGQTTITANLPMAGFRHTGVGNASDRAHYAVTGQAQDSAYTHGTAGGTADAITLTVTPAIAAYATGQSFSFVASAANTGAVTLNVSGLGAKAVTKRGTTALVAGEIASGATVNVRYDGTRFQLDGGDKDSQGSDIPSASTINLDSATWNLVDVTGTTTITAITLAAGREVTVRFTGALTLTHGSSLVLPSAANITTAAGDFAVFRGYSGGVVRCVNYARANGTAVAGAQFKVVSTTRDISTASGTQSITGAGFRPKFVQIRATSGGSTASTSSGSSDGSTHKCVFSNSTGTGLFSVDDVAIRLTDSGGTNYVTATVSFTADGCDLAWVKTGSPTGIAALQFDFQR